MVSIVLLIIIYLSFISLGLPDAMHGSAWPSMYEGLNVPLHYAGYLFMIMAIGTIMSSLFSGKIIARFGTGIVTAVSVLMTAAALFGFSFSSAYWMLCLWSLPLGLGGGAVDTALNNYVAVHYKARHMSWLHCFWGVGASTGPLVMSYFLINNNSWSQGYRTIGIAQLSLAFILFATLFLWVKNKSDNTAGKNTASEKLKFKHLIGTSGVKHVLVAFFTYCSLEATVGLWGSSFLVLEKGIAPEIAAKWISLYFIGITSGRFVSGFLTMKLNNWSMIRLGQCLIACGIAAVILPFNALLLPGFFTIGLGCAPVFPSLIHETPRNFGVEKSQSIIGLQMACAYIGVTFTPPLFGWIASGTGFFIFSMFIGIFLVLNIIMIEILHRKVSKNSV
jgi:fucose permease